MDGNSEILFFFLNLGSNNSLTSSAGQKQKLPQEARTFYITTDIKFSDTFLKVNLRVKVEIQTETTSVKMMV